LLRNEVLIESGGDYGKKCKLNDVCRLDLSWWLEKLPNSFNFIRSDNYKLTLTTDSSTTGWGAHTDVLKHGFHYFHDL
jgi:hypothetical protein